MLYQKSWLQILVHVKCHLYVTCSFVFVVLFVMLYKVVLTFESVDEILKCDHSNQSYRAVLSCSVVYYAVQGGSNL